MPTGRQKSPLAPSPELYWTEGLAYLGLRVSPTSEATAGQHEGTPSGELNGLLETVGIDHGVSSDGIGAATVADSVQPDRAGPADRLAAVDDRRTELLEPGRLVRLFVHHDGKGVRGEQADSWLDRAYFAEPGAAPLGRRHPAA